MKLLIFYFSGTGNTEYITEKLKEGLEKRGNYVELVKAEDVLLEKVSLADRKDELVTFDKIGLGFPVYGFNAPRIIHELVAKHVKPLLDSARKPEFFVFSSCAGPLYLNEIAHFRLKKELERDGIRVEYERQFFMPANIFAAYPEEVNLLLVRTSERKADIMAGELSDGWKRLREDKYLPYFFGWIRILEQAGWKSTSKYFKVSGNCTGCGHCVKSCPAGNIHMAEGKPTFGNNCYVCMRCIYGCPEKAIGLGIYNFAILKNGYRIEDFTEKEVPKDLSVLEKGYLRSLKKYVEQVN